MKFSKYIVIFGLLLFASSNSFACGSNCASADNKTESKSCCASKDNPEQKEKKSCCSKEKKSKKHTCNGDCKHKGCHCSSISINYFVILDEKKDAQINIFSTQKLNFWGLTESNPTPVYLAIWQPPKI